MGYFPLTALWRVYNHAAMVRMMSTNALRKTEMKKNKRAKTVVRERCSYSKRKLTSAWVSPREFVACYPNCIEEEQAGETKCCIFCRARQAFESVYDDRVCCSSSAVGFR